MTSAVENIFPLGKRADTSLCQSFCIIFLPCFYVFSPAVLSKSNNLHNLFYRQKAILAEIDPCFLQENFYNHFDSK